MDYQKIIFFWKIYQINYLNLGQKVGVEIIDDAWKHVQQITPIAKVIKLEAIISKSTLSLM